MKWEDEDIVITVKPALKYLRDEVFEEKKSFFVKVRGLRRDWLACGNN